VDKGHEILSGDFINQQRMKPAEFRREVVRLHRQHINQSMAKLAELMDMHVEVRSSGNYVFDENGEKYLDCGGYGVFILGHCHPQVVRAVQSQLERHPLSTRALLNAEVAMAAAALAAVTPPGLDYIYFGSSGAEATEAGIKIACLNGKHRLISMTGGYHGKTLGALSVTGRSAYRAPFQSILTEVSFLPFGDRDALEQALTDRGSESCVILEPIQAEGGVIIPPPGYLKEVESLCRQYGAFLILDEIQTGLGRLGAWWGADREQVVPDVLLVGKALGGGVMPVSAAVTSAHLYEKLNKDPLLHTSTFSGNPLATAAARAAIQVIEQAGVVSKAQALGERILVETQRILLANCPELIQEVRGVGLLTGIEFKAAHLAADFMFELMQSNVIISYSLNAHRVARLTPPAFLNEEDVAWLMNAVQIGATALAERYAHYTFEED
jgi:putrescine aminotransferase